MQLLYCLPLELLFFPISFFNKHVGFPEIIGILDDYRPLIGGIAIATAIIWLVILWITRRSLQTTLKTIKRSLDRANSEISLIQSEKCDAKNLLSIHEQCEDLFRNLAVQNAEHDKQVFDRLFINFNKQDDTLKLKEIESAIGDAAGNIRDILNVTHAIFTEVTGINAVFVCK